MASLEHIIQSYLSKSLQITLAGKVYSLHVIDWKTIVEKHEALMDKIEEMEEEEAGEYLIEHESELMQITENFMNDACDEKVEDEKWIPFGLLGLSQNPEHFSETDHHGLLLLDMTKSKTETVPVLHFKKGKTETVAASIEELLIKEI